MDNIQYLHNVYFWDNIRKYTFSIFYNWIHIRSKGNEKILSLKLKIFLQ